MVGLANLPQWMQDVGLAGLGALLFWLAQFSIAWRKQSADERTAATSTGLAIKQHRDGLTIQMLEMARAELLAARSEINGLRAELEQRADELGRLRRIEWRLTAYEEAIDHIETLLKAEIEGGREAAENAARLFLARMEAMKLKMGDDAQTEQVRRSARKLIDGEK